MVGAILAAETAHTRIVPVTRLVRQKKSALDSAGPAAPFVPIAHGQAGLLFPGFALQRICITTGKFFQMKRTFIEILERWKVIDENGRASPDPVRFLFDYASV